MLLVPCFFILAELLRENRHFQFIEEVLQLPIIILASQVHKVRLDFGFISVMELGKEFIFVVVAWVFRKLHCYSSRKNLKKLLIIISTHASHQT